METKVALLTSLCLWKDVEDLLAPQPANQQHPFFKRPGVSHHITTKAHLIGDLSALQPLSEPTASLAKRLSSQIAPDFDPMIITRSAARSLRLFKRHNVSHRITTKAHSIEEGTLKHYSPELYYPVHINELFHHRYRTCVKLGYGGYSTVWLCRDETYVP